MIMLNTFHGKSNSHSPWQQYQNNQPRIPIREAPHKTHIKVSHKYLNSNPQYENTVGIKIQINGPNSGSRLKTIEIDDSLFPRKNTPQRIIKNENYTGKIIKAARSLKPYKNKEKQKIIHNQFDDEFYNDNIPDSISISLNHGENEEISQKINKTTLNVMPITLNTACYTNSVKNKKHNIEDCYDLRATLRKKSTKIQQNQILTDKKSRNNELILARTAKTEQRLQNIFDAYQTLDSKHLTLTKFNEIYNTKKPKNTHFKHESDFSIITNQNQKNTGNLRKNKKINPFKEKFYQMVKGRNHIKTFSTIQPKCSTSQGPRINAMPTLGTLDHIYESETKNRKTYSNSFYENSGKNKTKIIPKKKTEGLFSFGGSTSNLHKNEKNIEKKPNIHEIGLNQNVQAFLRVPNDMKPQFFFDMRNKFEDEIDNIESDFSTPGFMEQNTENDGFNC